MKNLKKILLLLLICGVFGDDVKKVSLMEGESVSLNSNLTEINTYWKILWRFGSDLIAQISEGKISYKPGPDGRFRDRLQLDSETASLTITNMKMKHSGLYEREAISSNSGTTYKRFNVSVNESPSAVTVEAELKSVSVTTGESLTLQTDVLHPRDELIVWRFGNQGKLIAKADLEAKINSLHEDIDERFRDRLKLDQTGSLTINNMRNTDSGLYIVKISSSKQTLHKRFSVTVSDPGLSSVAIAGIVVFVLLVILAVAVVCKFFYNRWKESEKILEENKKMLEENKKMLEENKKMYEAVISEQLLRISEELKKLPKNYENLSNNYEKLLNDYEELKQLSKIYEDYQSRVFRVEMKKVMEGESVTLNPDPSKIQGFMKIQWVFGDNSTVIAVTNGNDISYFTGRFSDRLKLNRTGYLTINNMRINDTGLYKLQISSNTETTYMIFSVTVSDPGLSPGAVAGIVLLLLFSAAGVFYYRHIICDLKRKMDPGPSPCAVAGMVAVLLVIFLAFLLLLPAAVFYSFYNETRQMSEESKRELSKSCERINQPDSTENRASESVNVEPLLSEEQQSSV